MQTATEIPIPANFPVAWESEDERKLLWRWDDIHSPLPASPMSVSVGEATTSQGSAKASQTLKRPGRGLRRRIHGYSYSANIPEQLTPQQQEAQRAAMDEAIADTRQRWDAEFLPTIERNLGHMRGLDMDAVTEGQLLTHLDEFLKLHSEHWRIHGLVVMPLHTAVERAAALYREIMGPVPDDEPYALFGGIDNKSLETDRALQALAHEARTSPLVAGLFAEETSPHQVMARLRESKQGREFLVRLEQFLAVYGYRPTGFDYIFPCWKEDPSFVILNVKAYLSITPRDLEVERARLSNDAERCLGRALDRLEGDEARRGQLVTACQRARELFSLKEDHAFYIDQGSTAAVRMLIAEIGRRLARREVLAAFEDVFFLSLSELREAMAGESSGDIRHTVASRRAERQRFMRVIPPPFLGTLPPEGAPIGPPEFQRMTGPVVSARPDEGVRVLRGVSGSRGTATGPAKVVRSPDEFAKVRPGDVLVCTSTSPTWTPLFGSVSALVSDSGGVLSHTAIVAREYKLPAVVGVKFGTSTIADGQVITVDGDAGVVILR